MSDQTGPVPYPGVEPGRLRLEGAAGVRTVGLLQLALLVRRVLVLGTIGLVGLAQQAAGSTILGALALVVHDHLRGGSTGSRTLPHDFADRADQPDHGTISGPGGNRTCSTRDLEARRLPQPQTHGADGGD